MKLGKNIKKYFLSKSFFVQCNISSNTYVKFLKISYVLFSGFEIFEHKELKIYKTVGKYLNLMSSQKL